MTTKEQALTAARKFIADGKLYGCYIARTPGAFIVTETNMYAKKIATFEYQEK